jgi:hypothetical protein
MLWKDLRKTARVRYRFLRGIGLGTPTISHREDIRPKYKQITAGKRRIHRGILTPNARGLVIRSYYHKGIHKESKDRWFFIVSVIPI